jgi:hypothetical protein
VAGCCESGYGGDKWQAVVKVGKGETSNAHRMWMTNSLSK